MSQPAPKTVLTVLGTRPEVIKLAPVLSALAGVAGLRSVLVSTGQQADLLPPVLALFGLRPGHDLALMRPGQTPAEFTSRALAALEPVLAAETPGLVLVQGDTSTALAGALAAFYRGIDVGHVEAGLRSGDPRRPFPEEMNRRLITRLAALHFAPTHGNREALLAEGVPGGAVWVTGNPVVDALRGVLARGAVSPALAGLLARTEGRRRLLVTTHRRESFGGVMAGNLRVLAGFVAARPDVELLFPVHPNPQARGPAEELLGGRERVHLLPPLDYPDFVGLLGRCWLAVSDSGGVQEEAPALGVPLLVLRDVTERPEAVACGAARLAGGPERLRALLAEADASSAGGRPACPFGDGASGPRIAGLVARFLGVGV